MPLHLSFKNLYVTGCNDIITIGKEAYNAPKSISFFSEKWFTLLRNMHTKLIDNQLRDKLVQFSTFWKSGTKLN